MGASIAAVGSSVAGGVIGAGAANDAKNAAISAQTANNAAANSVYKTNTGNLQPFVDTGHSANSALAGLLGIGGDPTAAQSAFSNYLGSTNYNFQLGQGLNAVKTAEAPAFNSGATAKALNNYAQGQAGSALAGYEGQLGGLSTNGIQSAASLGTLGNQYAAQTASNNNAAAGAIGAADITGANAITGALKGVTSGLSSFGSAGGPSALAGLFGGGGGTSAAPVGADVYGFNGTGFMPFSF